MTEWNSLLRLARTGRINRRDFMGGAAMLGISAASATGAWTGAAQAQATPNRGGHLIVGLDNASASDSLNPATYSTIFMQVVGHQLYNTLTEIDENARLQPVLLESWEAKPGAREWVFKLRKDITFHNGKTLEAADVVHSLNHHRKPDSTSGARALLAAVTELKATDTNEFTVVLESGNADLPALFSVFHLCIGPDGTDFTDGIGTGSFMLESFEPGVRARTRRNPNNWRDGRGFVDTVETIGINDPTARINALISGSVHLINRVSPRSVELLKGSGAAQVFEVAGAAHCTFPMRCDVAPFDNNDMRLALKYAIDREAVVSQVLVGHGRVGNDHPIPEFDPFYAGDLAQRTFDPDRARHHFQKTGHSGPITLHVSDVAFLGAVETAQVFQASAARAGITINIERVPSDGYFSTTWMNVPFCASFWQGRPTADILLSTVYKSDAAWNETFWRRENFDALLLAARSELDQDKRREMYHEMQQMIHDDAGSVIPMFNNTIDAGATKIAGFVPRPMAQMCSYRAPELVWFQA